MRLWRVGSKEGDCAQSGRLDVILTTAGSPCRVLSRVDETRLGFEKGPSGSGMKKSVAKG